MGVIKSQGQEDKKDDTKGSQPSLPLMSTSLCFSESS